MVLSERSNQLAQKLKKELADKMDEFVIPNDSLEEVFENREQIEISKFYERLPKPQNIAVKELEDGQIYFRHKEVEEELTFDAHETKSEIEKKSGDKSEEKNTDEKTVA